MLTCCLQQNSLSRKCLLNERRNVKGKSQDMLVTQHMPSFWHSIYIMDTYFIPHLTHDCDNICNAI